MTKKILIAIFLAATACTPPPLPTVPGPETDGETPSCRDPADRAPYTALFAYEAPAGWERIGRMYSSQEQVLLFAHRQPQDSQAQVNVLVTADLPAICAAERDWLESEGATVAPTVVLPDGSCRFGWHNADHSRAGAALVRHLGSKTEPNLAVKVTVTGLLSVEASAPAYAETVSAAFKPAP